ncbi:phosphatidylinositol 4-kinase beta-like [Symsagittifera roscoffensis]|uniref:phosphatidylinositol 4-kinase beta-like n=1 Tax=Symsagittifera roscoffensis TaxID=84072 RepID=UPI00307B8753
MADISNFRRNLLSPVPEQEVVVIAEPRPRRESLDANHNRRNQLNCPATSEQNLPNGTTATSSVDNGPEGGDATTPGANLNDLSLSGESGEFSQGPARSKSKEKDKDKKKDQLNAGTAMISERRASNKFLPSLFFNKRKSTNDDSLIRLFSSEVFDASLAISYLFSSKEQGVLDYIGNRIFEFNDVEMDMYLPQLMNLYCNVSQVASSVEKYIKARCTSSVDFSLTSAWLLGALIPDTSNPKKKLSRGAKLRKQILDEEFKLKTVRVQPHAPTPTEANCHSKLSEVPGKSSATGEVKSLGHHRSKSDAPQNLGDVYSSQTSLCPKLGDLSSGCAFSSGCRCFDGTQSIINDLKGEDTECKCGAPRLSGELEFINQLLAISKKIQKWQTRDQKTNHLFADLANINMNLPARVWIPNSSYSKNHHVVRIPQNSAFVLNSKEKAPYMIYFEVIECSDKFTAPIPAKRLENSLRTTKSVENIIDCSSNGSNNGLLNGAIETESSPPHNISDASLQQVPHVSSAFQSPPVFNHSCSTSITINGSDLSQVCGDDDDQEGNFYVGDLGLSVQHTVVNGNGTGVHYHNGYETASLFSHDSIASSDSKEPNFVSASDIRRRLSQNSSNSNGTFKSDPDDPSAAALKEPWEAKVKRIRESSPYGDNETWKLIPMIIKVGDDLRLELLCSQFISALQSIWLENKVELKVSPVNVLVTGPDSGFIEPLMNTVSLHQIKKQHHTLPDYFRKEFGEVYSETFLTAQLNFVRSVAAYSLICYLLQVKDRHNGNILLDNEGHIIHIDYGFVLNMSPKNMGFESSAFKLTQEYVEIIGGSEGIESNMFTYYKLLMLKGLLASRKHVERLVMIFDVMTLGNTNPFTRNGASAVKALRDRFHINKTEQQLQMTLDGLIEQSYHSLSTAVYDKFQYVTNGIF